MEEVIYEGEREGETDKLEPDFRNGGGSTGREEKQHHTVVCRVDCFYITGGIFRRGGI